ncbi:MAG: cell envelope integrity protein CreD [Tannerella sp.]|nr:cell envelope integrity protein CreD [Tannerella sp.]
METEKSNPQTGKQPTPPQWEIPSPPPPATGGLKLPPHWHMFIKVVLIGVLTLLLMIPMMMIENLIGERERTAENATDEVHQKWSGGQTVLGPVLTIPFKGVVRMDSDGKVEQTISIVNVSPETLEITGDIRTEELKRGLYKIVVYHSPIEMKGTFVLPEDLNIPSGNLNDLHLNEAMINIGISDLRGIGEQVTMTFGEQTLVFNPGIPHNQMFSSGVSCKADVRALLEGQTISFSVKLELKGSESLYFAPLGKTTSVALTSDCRTPSFTGAFLPDHRDVTGAGFTSDWKVMHLNRNYPQALTDSNWNDEVTKSVFGVDMLMPVQHYQKSMRSVKYAMLIILLTFVVSFFVEVLQKKQVHPFQYLLIGLALCLFYSLLISISEHTGFTTAYTVASAMTVSLITCYMAGVLKIKRTALTIGALLACLYVYIFVLIQMETYALLAGSIGLFVILAVIMYVSQRINWSGRA